MDRLLAPEAEYADLRSIVTDRIVLRRLALSDARCLYDAVHESRRELGEWLDWCHEDYSIADATEWVERNLRPDVWKKLRSFGVFERGHDRLLVGCVGLSDINWSESTANLGYWVRTSKVGNGIAREAASAMVEYAHEHFGLRRLEIAVHPLNLRSSRVARALKARDEGVVPARIMYKGAFVGAHLFTL